MAKNKAHAKALERLNRVSVDAREEMIERGSLPKPGQGPDESTFFFLLFECDIIHFCVTPTLHRTQVRELNPRLR